MIFRIEHQENYSRGELLLRSFFGFIYIGLPHFFLLGLLGLWGAILTFISFWSILFTGRYPQSFFEFQVNLIRWSTRVNARIWNLSDGYPAFGLSAEDEYVKVEVPYPDSLSRGMAIVKLLFGALYVGIPHGFILLFRYIGAYVLMFLAWWAVLFTGRFPEGWHAFIVNTMRWGTRVSLYLSYMTDDYPPFNGLPDPDDSGASAPAAAASPAPAPAPPPPAPESGAGDEENKDNPA